jgi:hypothetical protein
MQIVHEIVRGFVYVSTAPKCMSGNTSGHSHFEAALFLPFLRFLFSTNLKLSDAFSLFIYSIFISAWSWLHVLNLKLF